MESELAAAFVASILTFGFGWLLAERQRRENLKLRSIESERAAIEELQDAAARLASAAGTAALKTPMFLSRDVAARLDVLDEPWFQDWLVSSRQLEIAASHVTDVSLKPRARAVRDVAMDRSAFELALADPEASREHFRQVDDAIEELHELAGRVYRELYKTCPPPIQRWLCQPSDVAGNATNGPPRERWLCNRL
jgi:hypothetical protein